MTPTEIDLFITKLEAAMKRIDEVTLDADKAHDAYHGLKEALTSQSKDIGYLVKTTEKIELGMWGLEGCGGLLGEVTNFKTHISRVKGFMAAISISLTALTAWVCSKPWK